VALGWHIFTTGDKQIIWHNGRAGGYRSFMGFDPKAREGVVLLSNAETVAGIDDIGRHLLDPSVPVMTPPKEHKQVTIDPKLLDGYVGRFPTIAGRGRRTNRRLRTRAKITSHLE
jgi:D-alanyl-D-alanine-carboxypeptidase/D-alanyl-D-alanine-endopeptidase